MDRVAEPFATGARFAPRELPMDAVEFVRRGLRGQQTYPVDVSFGVSAEALPGWLQADAVPSGGGCRVRFESGDSPDWQAARLALTGLPFTVHAPEFLAAAARDLAARLTAGAGAAPGNGASPSGDADAAGHG